MAKKDEYMHYVYLIKSLSFPTKKYVGLTTDLKKRLSAHNNKQSKYTSKYVPWELVCYHAFSNKRTAQAFEYYLKTASGKAFANKRFWT